MRDFGSLGQEVNHAKTWHRLDLTNWRESAMLEMLRNQRRLGRFFMPLSSHKASIPKQKRPGYEGAFPSGRLKMKVKVTCMVCDKEMLRWPCQIAGRVFCSNRCQSKLANPF